ncbi:MAG: hypothetical protein BGO30_08290 [Bacteroidetes bacterium 41-46]|nr:MAG: hypothetical protein BGO30_08290 [Bacteroidetes bacterium 41-46]
MEATTQPGTALQTVPNIQEIQIIIGDAPATLIANTASRDNACKAGEELIIASKNVGMSPDLDNKMSSFIEKAKKTLKAINEKRRPFTQMMDELKKRFTECENDIKTKVDEVQKVRDSYAAELMKKRQEEERRLAIAAAKEKERISIVQKIKDEVAQAFYNYVVDKKNGALNYFNSITLEDFEAKSRNLEGSSLSFTPAQLSSLSINVKGENLDQEEVNEIAKSILTNDALHIHYANEYRSVMSVFKKDLVDKLPSKKQQLEELKAAADNEAERERILAEEKKRQAEEAEKISEEAKVSVDSAKAQTAAEAAESEASTSLNSLFATAGTPVPAVKESVQIVVKSKAAYALLFQYWFERKGKDMDEESIENMTLKRIKTFCENYIKETGEIIESSLIEIKEVYKAK